MDTFKIIEELIGTEAGLISGDLYKIPNRHFIPSSIHIMGCEGVNLNLVGANTNAITVGGGGFSEREALLSTVGEFSERYCSSFYNDSSFIYGSYIECSKMHVCLNPADLRLYSENQYDSTSFSIQKLGINDAINWVKCFRIKDETEVYIPAFLIYLPYVKYGLDSNYYLPATSTGLSSSSSVKKAIQSGLLETVERHAFSYFWYMQSNVAFPYYSQKQILAEFPTDQSIKKLFTNDRVKITTFDLSEFMNFEVSVCILFYNYKGQTLQSLGASARFSKKEAIIKACLEAYQGIDFGIMLSKQNLFNNDVELDLKSIDSFEKHFAFYNAYPHLRNEVPILRSALRNSKQYPIKYQDTYNSFDDILKDGPSFLDNAIYCDLTCADIASIGFNVVRVYVPDFSFLTGHHAFPFLGSDIFKNQNKLFLKLPHPFP